MKLLIAQIYSEPRGLQAGETLVPHRVMEARVHGMEDVGFEVRWTWVQTPALPDRQGEQGHGVTWSSLGCPTARLCTWKRSSELSNAARGAPSTW